MSCHGGSASASGRKSAIFRDGDASAAFVARIGTSPLDLLRRSVPGYLRTNDPSLIDRDTRFDPMPDF